MYFGRLYNGKYIPPERTDGLLPECEEEESVNEEATIETICDEVLILVWKVDSAENGGSDINSKV